MNTTHIVLVGAVIMLMAVLGAFFVSESPEPEVVSTEYDAFAQCLGDQKATFYGAFWCPNCDNQKNLFGASEKLLPYVECSLPDRSGQYPICLAEDIQAYPTWKFADGSVEVGTLSLGTLADKTGCELPGVTPETELEQEASDAGAGMEVGVEEEENMEASDEEDLDLDAMPAEDE